MLCQNATAYTQIAHVSKPKGLKGQFVVSSCNELPYLQVGTEVWVVPPSLYGVRNGTITEVQARPGSTDFLVSMTGVHDVSAAAKLQGRYLLARVVAKSKGLEAESPDNSGASASDPLLPATRFLDVVAGELGELVAINQGPAYEIWVVTGPYGELLIPAVDAYIAQQSAGCITLRLPKGFLDINRRKGE